MTTRPSDLELEAWQSFLHAHDRLIRRLDEDLRRAHGLSLNEYDVLVRLARAPGRRLGMTELARRVMMSPSGLTRVVDRLVTAGFVDRSREQSDARVMTASLTSSGRARARAAARTHLGGIREYFSSRMSEEELRVLAAALGAIAGPHEPH